MPDEVFFAAEGPFTLEDLGRLAGATVTPADAGAKQCERVAPLDTAGPKDVSFLDNPKYISLLKDTKAGAVIVAPNFANQVPRQSACLVSDSPYKAYALVAQAFYPNKVAPRPGISDRAMVATSVKIGENCQIDDGAVLGSGVVIGDETRIGANTVISENVKIGSGTSIGANVTLQYCHIGDGVIIHPGVRIGQDGFGFASDASGHIKVPQLGRVIVHDKVEIGANTTIDRGAGPDTVIGPGSMIDNLVQIGHNVQLGRGCVIVSQVGISGSTKLGDFVVLGGQVGVAGHIEVGSMSRVAAKSGISKSLAGGQTYGGYPAIPIGEWRRQIATISRATKRKTRERGL